MEFLKNQVKLKIHRIRLTGDWTLQKKRSAKLNKSQKKLLRLNHTEGNCLKKKKRKADFPGGPVVKNPPANAGDTGSNPGLGRFHIPQGNQAHVPQLRSPSRVARAPQQGKSSQ